MKKTVNMSRIESIVYEFSKQEILEALLNYYKIKIKSVHKYELDLYERYCDDTGVEQNPDYAELTIKYETNIPVL